ARVRGLLDEVATAAGAGRALLLAEKVEDPLTRAGIYRDIARVQEVRLSQAEEAERTLAKAVQALKTAAGKKPGTGEEVRPVPPPAPPARPTGGTPHPPTAHFLVVP